MSTPAKRFLRCETCLEILLISAVTALAYLPLVAQLGLYKEDWYLIWSGMARTPQDFLSLYQADRPFAGFIYQLVYPLLGPSPLGWHLLSFTLRLTTVLSFYWMLRMLWPAQRFVVVAAVLLFAVYPGYLQQHNAVNKTFWLTSLACAVLSLTLTVYATRLRKTYQVVLVHLVAMLLALVYMLIIEFYIGFDVVRFILLWYTGQQRIKASAAQLARLQSVPALPDPVFAFLYWRIFVFQSPPDHEHWALAGRILEPAGYMLKRIL
jgi:cell shape-determining protein MreD